jgi:hypothetical protein
MACLNQCVLRAEELMDIAAQSMLFAIIGFEHIHDFFDLFTAEFIDNKNYIGRFNNN